MIAEKLKVDPTERSMPPLRITMSIPSPRIAKIATCEAMMRRLLTVR